MFVFSREDLPPDPSFPADLKQLGYFINDRDQIRKISDPKQEFQFKINKNDRWNETQREAMNACIREIVSQRLRASGLVTLRLPLSSSATQPHVPILVSSNISTASRIIVVFGENVQDLGIWAYRNVSSDGIAAGSAVSFARAVLGLESDTENATSAAKKIKNHETALVLTNPGQLIWHCGSSRAMSLQTWLALPRLSAVDPPDTMSDRNKIPRNETWHGHICHVFETLLNPQGRFVRKDAKIDIIGLADGGLGAIRYLADEWDHWRGSISAICISHPLHHAPFELDQPGAESSPSDSFPSFVSSRCRAYVLSDKQVGLPVPGSDEHVCNCYSSGEELNVECIMPAAWKDMLEWLTRMYESPELCEEQLKVQNGVGQKLENGVGHKLNGE
ncbi:Arb2 domain-domain-containing protein [Aspergillus taichungensis]|uniref:Arb2 domain-domain-containing protein n=1 Tax=Aspergillus taichungensis TaxID=482145 RepID=A0A2J5HTR1_9EURO|nr:Arb2 domain-domain-containing protein [Aspergillus taichungensis]